MADDVFAVVYAEQELDALPDDATSSDIWRELYGNDPAALASILARRVRELEDAPESTADALAEALGWVAQSCDISAVQSGAQMTAGYVWFVAVYLDEGDVLTTLHASVNTPGVGVTLGRLGVYSVAGVRLAQTADIDTQFQTEHRVSANLTAPLTIATSGVYYFAVFTVAGTYPYLWRATADFDNLVPLGSNPARAYAQSGQTDLPATAVFETGFRLPWLAAS